MRLTQDMRADFPSATLTTSDIGYVVIKLQASSPGTNRTTAARRLSGPDRQYAIGMTRLASDTLRARTNKTLYVQRWHTALQEGPSLRCPDPEALQVRRQ